MLQDPVTLQTLRRQKWPSRRPMSCSLKLDHVLSVRQHRVRVFPPDVNQLPLWFVIKLHSPGRNKKTKQNREVS